jgi:acyl-CoA oxidase
MSDFTDNLRPRYDGPAILQAERSASALDADQLSSHLLARDDFLGRQNKVLQVLRKEKLFNKDQQLNLSRPERYHLGLARAKAIQRLVQREGWNHEDYKMAEYLNDEMSPFALHMTMFGTQAQLKLTLSSRRWLGVRLTDPCPLCSDDDTRAGLTCPN